MFRAEFDHIHELPSQAGNHFFLVLQCFVIEGGEADHVLLYNVLMVFGDSAAWKESEPMLLALFCSRIGFCSIEQTCLDSWLKSVNFVNLVTYKF